MSMCYTDFVVTPEDQYMAGEVHIILLYIQILGNFGFVVRDAYNIARLVFIKYYRRYEASKIKPPIPLTEEEIKCEMLELKWNAV